MNALMVVIVCIAACTAFTGCSSGKTNNQQATQKSYPRIENEPDQTDIFAIPLDTSEEEEQQEMAELQNIGTQEAKKKEKAQQKKL